MALDPSIALQSQAPDPTNFISKFVDLGQKKLNLDKARATFNADVAQRQAESSTSQSNATVNAANVQPLIDQQAAQTSQSQSQASVAKLDALRTHVGNVIQSSSDLLSLPDPELTPDAVKNAITQAAQHEGAPPGVLDQALARLPQNGNPSDLRKFLVGSLVKAQGLSSQLGAQFPAPQFVNNGQQAVPVAAGNPAITGVEAGARQGRPVQMQPPPTAQTFNPQTNQPEMYGARPGGPGGPVATGPALGVAEGVQGMTAPNVAHFNQVVSDASAAPTRIGLLQNIKALAPGAMTGDATTVKQIVSKLANYVGWAGSEQTSTDVMAKEAALLASKGGNTDLARVLNEAATPNGHMTKDAILATADQLIGQEKLKVAAQQYFSGTPPNSPLYAEKLKAWSAADPRAFEYAVKTPAERSAMLSNMSQGDQAALKKNMQKLHMLGVSDE